MNISTSSSTRRAAAAARLAGAALVLAGATFAAFAQYKIVSPDGHVTYTDHPPVGGANAGVSGGAAKDSGGGGLPYDVRQANSRYPVTLYAARGCAPCDQVRGWLKTRGVPFNEYSIQSNDDILQLQQRFNDSTVPVVTIGSQVVKNISISDLQSYIDAAGYPAQSRLTGYNWPAAIPLAPQVRNAPPAQAATPAAPSPTLPAPSANGIQF